MDWKRDWKRKKPLVSKPRSDGRQPYKLWSLEPREPYPPLLPPIPVKVRAEKPVNPYTVMNGGLKRGDVIKIDWLSDEIPDHLRGCQVTAYRERKILLWASGGFGRDGSGKFLCLPCVTRASHVMSLVEILTRGSGYTFIPLDSKGGRTLLNTPVDVGAQRFLFEMVEDEAPSRRVVSGDHLFFRENGTMNVVRNQATIDMNLYRPALDEAGVVLSTNAGFLSMHYHRHAVARILAEVNGFQIVPSNGGFIVAN